MSESVSVIIPVFNGAAYLRQAVESALAQTHAPLEVIVCDDGSTDATPEIARALAVVYLRRDNAGVSAARNAAIERARGDYLALLDADDVWLAEKLAAQLAMLSGERFAYASCHFRYLLDEGSPAPPWLRRNGPESGEPGFFAPSCWLLPRTVWERVGPFRSDLRQGEDIDWLARASDLGVARVMAPETLVLKRVHARNLTGEVPSATKVWLDTLRASVARKRRV